MIQYTVKAFSPEPLNGNPAAVVVLRESLSKSTMQRIAFINGFPETVFLLPHLERDYTFSIWWFTPEREVYDAGHATLAAKYVLMHYVLPAEPCVYLRWDGGEILVSRNRERELVYEFSAALTPSRIQGPPTSTQPSLAYSIQNDLLWVFEDERAIRDFLPDFSWICSLPYRGLCITAPGSGGADYCARFFAPGSGVDEDFVTATAHAYLAQYWATEVGRTSLTGIQCSPSPGIVYASVQDGRTALSGQCCLYAKSELQF